jgi:hypothetical protein
MAAYDGSMTYEELLALARRLEGRRLETVTGKSFAVGVALECPFFTPASSGYGQSDGRKAAERFLERYNATGSLRPGDYADVTRNASYYVGMILADEHAKGRTGTACLAPKRSKPHDAATRRARLRA